MSYEERPMAVPGVVLWCRTPAREGTPPTVAAPAPSRILPDGCMDLVWDGRRLVVAGPDTRARWHEDAPGATYVGLRFARGTGPSLLGVAANEVTDHCPSLDEVWSARAARTLTERVADNPVAGMERWVIDRSGHGGRHIHGGLGTAVFEMAAAGVSVSDLSSPSA